MLKSNNDIELWLLDPFIIRPVPDINVYALTNVVRACDLSLMVGAVLCRVPRIAALSTAYRTKTSANYTMHESNALENNTWEIIIKSRKQDIVLANNNIFSQQQ